MIPDSIPGYPEFTIVHIPSRMVVADRAKCLPDGWGNYAEYQWLPAEDEEGNFIRTEAVCFDESGCVLSSLDNDKAIPLSAPQAQKALAEEMRILAKAVKEDGEIARPFCVQNPARHEIRQERYASRDQQYIGVLTDEDEDGIVRRVGLFCCKTPPKAERTRMP